MYKEKIEEKTVERTKALIGIIKAKATLEYTLKLQWYL